MLEKFTDFEIQTQSQHKVHGGSVVSGPQYIGVNGNVLSIANDAVSWERSKQFNP